MRAMSTKAPETIRIGDLEVNRMGYGAMRLPGEHVWGEPRDPDEARAVLRRAVALGVNLIDTSWYYGPYVADRLIVEALHPYPKGLVLATKLGGKRLPDKSWAPDMQPAALKAAHDAELKALRLDCADIVHLRWIGSDVPFADALGAFIDMKAAGKIRHIALSNVSLAQLDEALRTTPIVGVQNIYNVAHRTGGGIGPMHHADNPEAVLARCEEKGLVFMPFFPLMMGSLGKKENAALAAAAGTHKATQAQIALAWLLARSKAMLPIPGTSSVKHLEENWAAQDISLTSDEVGAIAKAAG